MQLSKNSVLSKHIKNGEVKRPDLAKNAVTARTVANRSLLAADFKSGQLPQGPKGEPGATRVTVRTAYGTGIVTAACQPGEVATGGGGHSPQFDGVVIASAPLSHPQAMFAPPSALTGGYTPTTWQARAVTVTVTDDTPPVVTVSPAEVITWVACAAP